MAQQHRGIVLRAPSAQKRTVTLFDEQLGKIQGIVGRKHQLSHGAHLSYFLKKGSVYYFLQDIQLLHMPLDWARNHFLFFHHVLELCDYFMPMNVRSDRIFNLISFLYSQPEAIQTPHAQKLFLHSFYHRIGLHPGHATKGWLEICIAEHPQVLTLKTASYLKILESNETVA